MTSAEVFKRIAARLRKLSASIGRTHYRRFAVSFAAGLVVLAAMRVPAINRSMFGQPDREMMQSAFKIRADLITGGDPAMLIDVDDSTIASVGDHGPRPKAPMATAPRGLIADTLDYIRTSPPGKGAKAVIVDVDFATPTPGDEAGAAKLHKVLADWAQTPSAPPLILARQAFPDTLFGGSGSAIVLPKSDFDDVVEPAPNIFWSQVKMMADQDGVVREFLPYECVSNPGGSPVLYSAVLLAYGFLQEGVIPPGSPAKHWLDKAKTDCAKPQSEPVQHGELINYHLSLGKGENSRVWPDLAANWKGFATCGADADRAVFRRVSVADVAAAGASASHELLCGRLVVLGGTNAAAADFEQTPLNEMAGPMIIANSVRGLEISNGGLKRVPMWIQLGTLLAVSTAITYGFIVTGRIREHWLDLKSSTRGESVFAKLRLLPFNPVVLNWVFAIAAHWTGIGLLLISLDHGYWGYLSAPAFASAAVGAMQEVADDEEDE
jgi:CHASE2 domain-containing sensor protein